MTNMNEKIENPLGTEPVGKLLRKFAVPSIISMLPLMLPFPLPPYVLLRHWLLE